MPRFHVISGRLVRCSFAVFCFALLVMAAAVWQGFGGGGRDDPVDLDAVTPRTIDRDQEATGVRFASASSTTGVRRDEPLEGREALESMIELLESGRRYLDAVPDYSATFSKHERVAGVPGRMQVMDLKVRHRPFSIYLKWHSVHKGREVLYVDGENEGNMLVHQGGWKGRLVPAIKLDPCGPVALNQARHPITDLGLKRLAERLLDRHVCDLERTHGVTAKKSDDAALDDRPCHRFVIEYENPEVSDYYRKAVVLIDRSLSVPVCAYVYTWPDEEDRKQPEKLDELTLVEFYSYTGVRLQQSLADAEFDPANTSYGFRR